MLISLNAAGKNDPTATGPVELLLDCHARIRQFSDLAVELTQHFDAPLAELADAARRVHLYFTVALPLHVADEDDSVAPRLEPLVPAALADVLQALEREHAEITARLQWLTPRWKALTCADADARQGVAELARPSQELRSLLLSHLECEETHLLPALRQWLGAEDSAEILAEMRSRRGGV